MTESWHQPPRHEADPPVLGHWRLLTARHPAAIAVIEIETESGGAMARTLEAFGQHPLATGRVSLRDIAGVDRGLVARWSQTIVHLMPHGGPAVVDGILEAIIAAGLRENTAASWPEACDEVEARMLAALSRAASPLAIDLLLDQPRRWREGGRNDPTIDTQLNRLIVPPLVALVGGANIGKSTLTNTLAGRAVSIVADESGTTRDHVGVTLDAAGLVVRWVDTPGLRETDDAIESAARDVAMEVASRADLIVLVCDAHTPPPRLHAGVPTMVAALRTDLGVAPFPHHVEVSARTGAGITELVMLVRECLLPEAARASERPWKFW